MIFKKKKQSQTQKTTGVTYTPKILFSPEVKIFWISLPFLITLFIVALINATPYFILLSGILNLIIGIIIFFYAVSLARSNQETRRERRELQSIVFHLEDALVVHTEGFKILYFNPAAEKLFNVAAIDIIGKSISPEQVNDEKMKILVQTLFPSLAPFMIERAEPGKYPQVVDLSFDDPQLELRVITNPITGEQGETVGFMKIIKDRTRDVALLKSKSEFITVASHQLRTPLTGINWALHSLEEDKSLSNSQKELVLQTLEATEQALGIVEDLLKVAKIEEGRFGYQFEEIDIIAFINEILTPIVPQAKELGLQVYFDYPKEPLPKVIADRQKLAMVFENLLDNAIRYNVKGGSVTIKVLKLENDPFVEVSIRDTGIGIPNEDKSKVFDKFFRAKNALKYETEGSGLGLYISRNIIRSHGGKMWFESEANHGSIFYFTLPTDIKLVPPKEIPLEY